ncbi:hypothetical protein Pcinc_034763, partial [Petrolisthes cinctipes]
VTPHQDQHTDHYYHPRHKHRTLPYPPSTSPSSRRSSLPCNLHLSLLPRPDSLHKVSSERYSCQMCRIEDSTIRPVTLKELAESWEVMKEERKLTDKQIIAMDKMELLGRLVVDIRPLKPQINKTTYLGEGAYGVVYKV